MVASAIFIMDLKGKIIISRNFRGDVSSAVSDRFASYIQEKDEMLEQQAKELRRLGLLSQPSITIH